MTAALTAIAPIEQGIVLIVDDTPDNLAVLSDALDLAGYMVLVAMDGTSALERMHRRRPDVVLLDAMMPGIDGFETCRRIKAQAELADIPVLFMTALMLFFAGCANRTQELLTEDYLKMGNDDLLRYFYRLDDEIERQEKPAGPEFGFGLGTFGHHSGFGIGV